MNDSENYVSGEKHHATQHQVHRKITVSTTSLAIAALIAGLCILSFTAGIGYQKHLTKTAARGTLMTGGRFGMMEERRAGDFGKVTAIDNASITISNQRTGIDKTYSITSSTSFLNAGQPGSLSDIKTGDTVIVETTSNSSSTANRIISNPDFGSGGPAGQADNGPTTTITQ